MIDYSKVDFAKILKRYDVESQNGTTPEAVAKKMLPADPVLKEVAETVLYMKFKEVGPATTKALQSKQALDIINNGLVVGMECVAKLYAEHIYYLPEIMMAAKTMEIGIAIAEKQIPGGRETKGTVVMHAAEGDPHDIGKNIAAVMMRASGYNVIDMGRDVPIVDAVAKVEEVIDRGGTVLVPCFAVGRTQEIMMLLKDLDYEMWVDGMGRSVTRLFLDYPEYLRDERQLKSAKRKFNEVRRPGSREAAMKGQIIVTTGGMLDGGPVIRYLNKIKNDPKSAILLVGYQADDTNGRMLMDHGQVVIDGEVCKVECELQKYDFSAHADRDQLIDFIKACDPDNVIFMHSEAREKFLPDLTDYNVLLPKTGEEFELDI